MALRTPVELTVGPAATDHIAPIWRGDAWAHRFRFAGLSAEAGDWTWKAQIATAFNTTAVATYTIVESVDDDDLIVDLMLTGAQTVALTMSAYLSDLQRRVGSGDPETLFFWAPKVSGQVTT